MPLPGVFDHQVDRKERAEGVALALGGEVESAFERFVSSADFSSPVPILEASGHWLGSLLKRIGLGIGSGWASRARIDFVDEADLLLRTGAEAVGAGGVKTTPLGS